MTRNPFDKLKAHAIDKTRDLEETIKETAKFEKEIDNIMISKNENINEKDLDIKDVIRNNIKSDNSSENISLFSSATIEKFRHHNQQEEHSNVDELEQVR